MSAQTSGHAPSHPGLFEVVWGQKGEFGSRLVALRDFAQGTTICPIQGCEATHIKAYSSVQIAADPTPDGSPAHMELCSDLLYVNHSCAPNVAFDVPGGFKGHDEGRWAAKALKDIKKGDTLTFAYFSTEWDMAQPFDCHCGSSQCLGEIRGAKHVPIETLGRYVINNHIAELKEEQWVVIANGGSPGSTRTNGHASLPPVNGHAANGQVDGAA